MPKQLDDMQNVTFGDLFDIEEIQTLQNQFALATGVASIITQIDGTPITKPSNFCHLCEHIIRNTEKGLCNCQRSDAAIGRYNPDGPIVQTCLSGGLWDAGASISVGGRHIANWLIGQVRNEAQDESKMKDYARSIGADEGEFLEAFRKVPSMSEEQFRHIAQALFTLAGQLSARAYQNAQQARLISERTQADLDIRDSEEMFRNLFESANDGILVIQGNRIIKCNTKMMQMLGCVKNSQIIGKRVLAFCPPRQADDADSKKMATEKIEAALCGTPQFFEWSHKRLDGSQFECEVSLQALEFHGELVIQAIVRDITERKKAQSEAEISLSILKATLESTADGLLVVGNDGRIIDINGRMAEMWRLPQSVINSGSDQAALQHVLDQLVNPNEFITKVQSLYSDPGAESFDMLDLKDGRIFERYSRPQKLGDATVGRVWSFRDVTASKRAEASLKESEAKFRLFFENMTAGIALNQMIYDEQGKPVDYRFLDVNPAFEYLTGTVASDLIGKTLKETLPGTEQYWIDIFGKVAMTGEPTAYEDYFETTGKTYETWVFSPAKDHFSVVFTDVTDRKLAEKALEDNAIQIQQANEDLVKRNAELDEFTYVASHDLQEPLRKLMAFSDLLKRDAGENLPERAVKDLSFISDAASRMQVLIQDLLNLSRAGRKAMREERVSLDHCLDEALRSLSVLIDETGTRIVRSELGYVVGDVTMITQLFQNLIANAIKFNNGDQREVRISSELQGQKVLINVTDNGIGIKPEYCDQIFMPFKRLHGREEYAGSGIGLSICRKTVERHGGRIWVESEPGNGSSFKFTLNNYVEEQINAAA